MTTNPVSRTETRRRAVEAPDDPRALLASMWPPLARSDLAILPKTLRRAAAVGGAAIAHGRIRRLMQFVLVIRKRAARYATTKTWSIAAPNGRVIRFPAADPGAVAFKEMADKHGGADYERALIEFVVPRLRPGDVFVDVGAHVGYVSAFAATTGAAVFAIEIQRELIPLIEQLATINDFDLLRPLHAGASRAAGLGMIPRIDVTPGAGLSSETHRITGEDPRSVADDFVPLITLDDAFGRDRLWPSIVKVDVEGHEIAVIEGARRIIERRQTTFVVEFHGHLIGHYHGAAADLLAAFPLEHWRWSQLADDGLRPIGGMGDVLPDPRDPNPKLVFEPRGASAEAGAGRQARP